MTMMNALTLPMARRLFSRAMVFIDGTNLFYRLETEKLRLIQPLSQIFPRFVEGRIQRILLYTVHQKLEDARRIHGEMITQGIRVVMGDGIQKEDGNVKEKGVDALLVADLVYHAAMKNFDYALLVSVDTDFRFAISRVEDFGCKTGVMAICTPLPERLQAACDEPVSLTRADLLARGGKLETQFASEL